MASSIFDKDFEFISVKRDGHLLEVTLNRPKSFNALHGPAHRELSAVWDAFEDDPDLWAAILTGAGEKAFCSGNDLKATARGEDISTPPSGFAGLTSRFDRKKPIICAVNGIAMGGGLEIVLACDLAIAEEHALMALPEVKVGLFAAAGGVQRLSRQIGRKAANELLLTGRHFSAARGLELGVVNSVCPSGKSMEAARELAAEILAASPTSVQATKEVLNDMIARDALADAMDAGMPVFQRVLASNDGREGVLAFTEKRKPNWTNS